MWTVIDCINVAAGLSCLVQHLAMNRFQIPFSHHTPGNTGLIRNDTDAITRLTKQPKRLQGTGQPFELLRGTYILTPGLARVQDAVPVQKHHRPAGKKLFGQLDTFKIADAVITVSSPEGL